MLLRLCHFLAAAAVFAILTGSPGTALAHGEHKASGALPAAEQTVKAESAAPVTAKSHQHSGGQSLTAFEPSPQTDPCADGSCSCCDCGCSACHGSAMIASGGMALPNLARHPDPAPPPSAIRPRAPSSSEQPPKSFA